MGNRVVQLLDDDDLKVTAYLDHGENLTIEGFDDVNAHVFGEGYTEYEYVIVVLPENIPRVLAALGAPPGSDVLEALEQQKDHLMRVGEVAWLEELGIHHYFWHEAR